MPQQTKMGGGVPVPVQTGGSEPDLPNPGALFQQRWWLEAAGGSDLQWTTCVRDGRVVGALAYVCAREWGLATLEMPPYTRTLGPILHLPESKRARRLRNTQEIVRELIARLPKHDRFQCTLDPEDQSAFPLALCGCSVGQNFTFRMPAVWEPEAHWMELHQKTRNLIRTAGTKLSVMGDGSIEDVLRLSHLEHGRRNRSDNKVLERISEAALAREQMTTLLARDAHGHCVAAATLVWDSRTLFYWQSSRDVTHPIPGANSLLVWESMLFAQRRGLAFDIDGYHSASAARFVSTFSLETRARASVVHMSHRGRVAQALGRLVGRGTGLGVQPILDLPAGAS